MGLTRTELFTPAQNELALVAKALGHPARIAIVQHLIKADSCINGDLVEELGLAQATVSQHLRELKAAGIIKGTIEGVKVNYCINSERWKQIQEYFMSMFTSFNCEDSNCC